MADTASTPADTTKSSSSTDTTSSTPTPADVKASADTSSTSTTDSTPTTAKDATAADSTTTGSSDSTPKVGDVTQTSSGDNGPVLIQRSEQDTAIAQPGIPFPHAVEDQHGIGRIVQTITQDDWVPAATDPAEIDVKLAEKRNAAEEERRTAIKEGRVDPVSGKLLTKDEWDARQQAGDGTRVATSRASSDEEAIA